MLIKSIVYTLIDMAKKATYNPYISRLVWRLHIAGVLRSAYFWLNRPKDGIIHTNISGMAAIFHVNTPWEFRALDPAGGMGKEQHVLDKLSDLIDPGDVMFDVGSNFGIYSVFFSKAVGSSGLVVAFEPESQAFGHLLSNLDLNVIKNVKAFQMALSDHTREEKLFLQYTGASRLDGPLVANAGYEIVNVMEGDQFILRDELPIPKGIKIDVEGHEWSVICGLKDTLADPRCKLVLCEIHPPLLPEGIDQSNIMNYLEGSGFNHIEIMERGTTEFHALAQKL